MEKEFARVIKQNVNLADVLEHQLVKWHFIPPGSPHFGGFWEAAVKSMKYHLKRVIGENKMTFEEMSTLLAQIEAILNSRPMCDISNGDESMDVLTPDHFLIDRPMIDAPEFVNDAAIGCLDRWKLVQKMRKHFWNNWTNDYLTNLQQSYKWKTASQNLQEGQVVIVKNEETHPARWPLGRIMNVHPGKDGLVRTVTVKTASNSLKRPINKICPLENVSSKQETPNVTRVNCTTLGSGSKVKISYI
ncbi:uncharacterized protein LOC131996964 [Stomoxys calcitrans]|uniref:uncharacterized protein LOC131996964 n=1 Tax=Stomoxys calcitrans TaxID=35570 RepID=UPI0027E2FCA5|nr:uncharacterized protein LOC131996964 [Stomoxys calcitrans]